MVVIFELPEFPVITRIILNSIHPTLVLTYKRFHALWMDQHAALRNSWLVSHLKELTRVHEHQDDLRDVFNAFKVCGGVMTLDTAGPLDSCPWTSSHAAGGASRLSCSEILPLPLVSW